MIGNIASLDVELQDHKNATNMTVSDMESRIANNTIQSTNMLQQMNNITNSFASDLDAFKNVTNITFSDLIDSFVSVLIYNQFIDIELRIFFS